MSRQIDKQHTEEAQSLLWVVSLQLGLLLLVFYYTFIGGQTALGLYDHTWRAITQWISSALIAGWLLWRWLNPQKVSKTRFDWPLLWLLATWLVSTALSVDPFRSQETVVFLITYLFFFFIAVTMARRPWLVEITVNAVLGAAGLMWTLGLLQLSWWYTHQSAMPALLEGNGITISLSTLPRLSVLGNPNTMAAYLVPIVPLTLHKLATASRWLSRFLLAIWGIMLIGALILTQSRGGLVGLVVALVGYGLIMAKRYRLLNGKASSKAVRIGLVLLVLVVTSYGGVILLKRGLSLQNATNQVRVETMTGAIKILFAHPLFGSGPGTFGEELLRHQHPLRELHAHAHNLLLTLAAETGLPGIIGIVWLGTIGLNKLRSTPQASGLHQASLRIGLAAALTGFLAHNMVDTFLEIPAVMLLVSVLFGFWVGLDAEAQPLSRRSSWTVNLAASIVLVVVTASGLRITQGLKAYNQAVRASASDDWMAAVDHLKEAIRLSPQSRFYPRQLGLAYGHLASRNPAYRTQAIAQYQKTLQAMDQFALDRANLSCLLWEHGEEAQATREMTLARTMDPNNSLYHLNLGHYLEAQGDYDEAWDEYASVLSFEPDYLKSNYWQQANPRKDHLPTIVERAIDKTTELEGAASINLARSYTYAGRFTEALRVYDQLKEAANDPAGVHIGRGEALLAMGKLNQALAEFDAAIALKPRIALGYHYRSIIYLRQDRLSEAAQNAEAALFLSPTPASYFQIGQVAQAQGDMHTAQQQYETAFTQATSSFYPDTRYPVEVARRPALAREQLPCLLIPHAMDDLVRPTLAQGDLLEREGAYAQVAEVYRRLLAYEPNEPRVKERLRQLCQQHPTNCQE